MAISVKHLFVSAKGDGSDATLVRPSNWNANHDIQLATSKIIGRLSAGPGAAEELAVTSYMIGLLNTVDYAALAVLLGLPTTGDAKLTFKTAADSGWILANDGSIGDALSGGTTRANADTSALFTFFYNTFSDAVVPIQTSTGVGTTRGAQGTAAVAYGNHCRAVVPRQLGRALIIGGTGSGLTNRALGTVGGEENHTLTQAEAPDHVHNVSSSGSGSGTGSGSASVSGSYSGNTGTISADHTHATTSSGATGDSDRSLDHSHAYNALGGLGAGGGGPYGWASQIGTQTGTSTLGYTSHAHGVTVSGTSGGVSTNHTHGFSGTVNSSGSCSVSSVSVSVSVSGTTGGAIGYANQAHNNMQPWTAWNIMIRL